MLGFEANCDRDSKRHGLMLNRREFLEIGSATGIALTAGATGWQCAPGRAFHRNFAPRLGMFSHHAGSEVHHEIRFLAHEGFRSIEDTGLRGKSETLQRQMGRELAGHGMSLACFTGIADFGRPTFASSRREAHFEVLRELRGAVNAADRVGGKLLSVVPGQRDAVLDPRGQRCNAISLLHRCADFCEPRGVVLALEPIDHGPGQSRMFLRSARQAADLCRAVGRLSCRILIDVYQQAAIGEDLPRLVADVGDVLGHVQLGDFPGRKEPGTGELDFPTLLSALDDIGYGGALGMEHGSATRGYAGERAVIDAYLSLDRHAQCRIA
jgi:hydroxypyruvate isomerase